MSFETHDRKYISILEDILEDGTETHDRTGVGTLSSFSAHANLDVSINFPLLYTKKMYWEGIVDELLWFLSGSTNVYDLKSSARKWWSPWADEKGNVSECYGKQWVDWQGPQGVTNQVKSIVEGIASDPFSRRHVLTAWNPGVLQDVALPPCHMISVFKATQLNDGEIGLSLHMTQRSGDMFLGVPVNWASYALLLYMVCAATGCKPQRFSHTIVDAHIYKNHIDQALEQIDRFYVHHQTNYPQLKILTSDNKEPYERFKSIKREDIMLGRYEPLPAIKAEMAV